MSTVLAMVGIYFIGKKITNTIKSAGEYICKFKDSIVNRIDNIKNKREKEKQTKIVKRYNEHAEKIKNKYNL